MAKQQIILGPAQARKLTERARAAGKFHRILITSDLDGENNISTGSVTAVPLDSELKPMSDADGAIEITGCPYPPDCETVG